MNKLEKDVEKVCKDNIKYNSEYDCYEVKSSMGGAILSLIKARDERLKDKIFLDLHIVGRGEIIHGILDLIFEEVDLGEVDIQSRAR